MAVLLFVDFRGPLEEVRRANLAVSKGALRPAMRRIAQNYHEIMVETYNRQRTPGYRWPPNSPRYRKYDKLKGNSPPGVRTGAVRRSHTTGRGLGAVEDIQNNRVTLGTRLNYANFSAAGQRRPRGADRRLDQFTETFDRSRQRRGIRGRKIPVRDPLLALYTPATRNLRKRIRERWQGYINEALGDVITDATTLRISRPSRAGQRRRNRSR